MVVPVEGFGDAFFEGDFGFVAAGGGRLRHVGGAAGGGARHGGTFDEVHIVAIQNLDDGLADFADGDFGVLGAEVEDALAFFAAEHESADDLRRIIDVAERASVLGTKHFEVAAWGSASTFFAISGTTWTRPMRGP